MCAPFKPLHNCPLRLLTIKTVFLVAIISARRVSELQALSSKPPFLAIHPDKVVLCTRASFLPKVVTPFHVGQSITLHTFYAPPHPSHEEERLHRLDPKRALAFYLDRTKDFQVDKQLFVGYVGAKKGKAVQKRTFSRWVLLCIKMCYALSKKLCVLTPPEPLLLLQR
ncbi:hypothetical protein NDU88_005441 [Pleurodeles waltl]|uniref:Uncharacterized protein n=1 Tax=Pleurodeles waltl TaxID=8319 RepID=A0AAV7X181_PLEWA|nr:hypothetical protein NDU88_005441 [Pleurodeles waltl]